MLIDALAFLGGLLVPLLLILIVQTARREFTDIVATTPSRLPANYTSQLKAVDIPPDSLEWPSQTEHPQSTTPALEWPSTQWDDPHFGRFRDPPITPPPASTPARDTASLPKGEHTTVSAGRAKNTPAAGVRRTSSAPIPHSDEDVPRLVNQMGVAGAVKHLMATQGMEFRTAVKYVQEHRQS